MRHTPVLSLILLSLLWPSPAVADTLYRGGDILTMRSGQPGYVEALLERQGRIVFAGDFAKADAAAIENARVVDLQGKTMTPGFIDTHVHYSEYALTSLFHNLRPWGIENLDAYVDQIKALAANTPEGEWIRIFGYESALIKPYRPLTRQDLD